MCSGSVLQCGAGCDSLLDWQCSCSAVAVWCSVVQGVVAAVRCSVVQCGAVAVWCSVLQGVAVAVRCSVLQCGAVAV